MGIKRCPSFSKRPGFPSGLRVLLLDCDEAQRSQSEQLLKECSYEVTLCSSTADVMSRLNSSCSYDILLADRASCKCSIEAEQLLSSAKGLPCIFMATSPSPEDVLSGVKMGAVDFLAKPLALGKLRNIWQHTVRKMMCNMNINCSDTAAAGLLAADELPSPRAGKPRVSMEVILEEDDRQAAAAVAAGTCSGKPPAAVSSPSSITPGSTSNGSVINYSNGPNMALAITSSFYEPSKASTGMSLSRCGSSAMTSCWVSEGAPSGSGSGGPDSPVIERPTKQQHGQHGPVRSCPSTRSLTSALSCHSSWTVALPASPSSDGLHKQASEAAAAAEADSVMDDQPAAAEGAPRCMKKAVRHPPAAGAAAHASAACKPPLAGKPAAQTSAQQQKLAAGTPAASASAGKPASFAGMPSVPLPTGLGPLPQGMVWGMPMCPLVRAPGIVPPANTTASAPQAAGMPMAPWGMCSMPMFGAMTPSPFIGSGYGVMPTVGMGMPYPAAPGFGTGMAAGMPAGGYVDPCGQQQMYAQQQMWPNIGEPQLPLAPAAAHLRSNSAAACAAAPTGAAAAAALDASFTAAELLGGSGSAPAATGANAMDVADDDAFDFMLGDITAEDDLPGVCGGLLDEDLSVLAGGSIKMSRELSSEMQALEADLQQQAAAAAAAAAGRCSFESSAAQRQRVSFDCSTASTCTAARASFEASQRCNSARVSFEVSTRSNRVSFEVNCHNSGKAPAPCVNSSLHAASGPNLNSAASAPAELLGSVSDLFAACSGDSSHGSGLHHVDSCGMLADLPDLQSLFASGDSSCPQDCADSALTDTAGLFLDVLDDMPIDVGLRKNDSFAELINASLPGLAH